MDNLKKQFLGTQAHINSRKWGRLTVESADFSQAVDGDLVVYIGEPFVAPEPLVRIQSECIFSQVFLADLCDCREQTYLAMDRMVQAGSGILVYLRVDGRGAGLAAKVAATAHQERGADTIDASLAIGVAPDSRSFDAIGEFLRSRGVRRVRMLTNNPAKAIAVQRSGVIVQHEPLLVSALNSNVRRLYAAKAHKLGHWIPSDLWRRRRT
jgi:GTP cyclohydrolase II